MKKISLFILASAAVFSARAYDFSAQIGGEYNKTTWYFEWVDDAHTMCRTAASPGLYFDEELVGTGQWVWTPETGSYEVKEPRKVLKGGNGINRIDWIVRDFGFPESVVYENRSIPIVEIGDFSFANNVDVQNVKIPSSVKKIGRGAFYGWNQDGSLDLGQVEEIEEFAFYGGKCKDLVLPASLKTIKEGAFGMWQGLTELVFDSPELEILGPAFSGCTNLKKVDIRSLKTLGESAFDGSSSLDYVSVDGVETIGRRAFAGCNIETIVIGDAVRVIEDYAFSGSEKTMSITLGSNVVTIGNHAFDHCRLLPSLVIPESVVTIGDYAFYECTQLCPIIFGMNVEYIGDFAFYLALFNPKCGNRDIILPKNLKYIGERGLCFTNTAAGGEGRTNGELTDIYMPATVPPAMDETEDGMSAFGRFDEQQYKSNAFYDSFEDWMYPFCCLHVPAGTIDDYRAAPGWKNFQCIIDDIIPDDSLTAGPEDTDKGSIQNVVGFLFLAIEPNVDVPDTADLTAALFPKKDVHVDEWEIYNDPVDPNDKIIALDGTTVTPLHLGQQLVLGYDTTTNSVWDGNRWVAEKAVVGAVMVFVCPTITLVYGDTDTSDALGFKAMSHEMSANAPTLNYEAETRDYASYQHLVVYNSYPKVEIISPEGIEFTRYEKGHFDENGFGINDENEGDDFTHQLVDISDAQFVGEGDDIYSNDYLVPVSSVTENRLVKVSSEIRGNATTTSISSIDIDDNISIRAQGRTITIVGAPQGESVKIYDINGELRYDTTDTTIRIASPGVYIITIAGHTVKAAVR